MVRLRRVSASTPGWSRVRHGRGFRYLDMDGNTLETVDIERCKKLVIPPAWEEVWICPVANGHLQAVGTDDAGRRQYLYHPAWRERRDAEKFTHMEGFAERLLARRATARRQIGAELDLRSVAATTFALLDLGMFRVGSDRYTEENGSYGLTTIEKSHVFPEGDGMTFAYVAKSGQELEVTVHDQRVVEVLMKLKRRRGGGPELLAFREDGQWRDLNADHVNEYVKTMLGPDYSAKDFRTWRGTVVAAHALARSPAGNPTARKRSVAAAMREVAGHLGNTPTVARASYVDPRVVDAFHDGTTVDPAHRPVHPGGPVVRVLEREVLELLGER